ncbi:MAG: phosphonopyruvate decarboxylase [bacterium]
MINAAEFVEPARRLGFTRYAGVPCSFLTPFINYVSSDPNLDYIASANEGDALATAAGTAIGGERSVVMMQNSGLGNAVSPLTSLTYVFRIPVLLITSHRGAPGVKDEPQHALMGVITEELLETMRVPWEVFPDQSEQIEPALHRAVEYMAQEKRPYGFVMKKGTVAPCALQGTPAARVATAGVGRQAFFCEQEPATRREILERVVSLTPETETVVIATTGYTGRELFAISDRRNHLYMVGSMGCASSLGLGLSLARPELRVLVVDGDGSALMRMGNLATIGRYGGSNLTHLVLDNEAYESTGGQATVSATVGFAQIAAACGYGAAMEGNDAGLLDALLGAQSSLRGPRFGLLKIRTGTDKSLPRPDMTPPEVLGRLMQQIGAQF